MKVLYLVYSPQKSFAKFSEHYQTNFPWADALIKEISGSEKIITGLVVPIKEDKFQRKIKDKISLYGVPDLPPPRSPLYLFPKQSASLSDSKIISHIIEAIEDFRPDIIQVFGTENIFGMIQQNIKLPVIIHFQGSVLVVTTKWFTGISKWEQVRALTLRKLIYRYGSYFEYFTFRDRGLREEIIMQNCRYFIGRTSFDRRFIKLLSPGASYFFCEEFLRDEFFVNEWKLPLTTKITCISILKGVTYKGLDLLIDTLAILKRYTSFNFEFRICGVSDNEEVVSILKKRHYYGNYIAQLRFLGKLETSRLVSELTSANLFIHPSYMENSPNSICEAMALGMPIIATNAGGTNSLIDDGHDGILVQEGDPYSMAAAILEMTSNSENAAVIGQNARKRAIHRHQPIRLKEEMISIYQSIVSQSEAN